MSYERHIRSNAPDAALAAELNDSAAQLAEDTERGQFLNALDAAPVEVTDWEANFIESFLTREDTRRGWWTPARRAAADKMRKQYAGTV